MHASIATPPEQEINTEMAQEDRSRYVVCISLKMS